jgi:hypothetical protein
MNKTTENLWKALENYIPPVNKTLVWKLIYDPETGKPISVTTDETDQPYIEISRNEADTYPHQDPRVSVVDGKIVRRVKKLSLQEIPNRLQVFPNDKGNIATDTYNMLLLNSSGNNRWKYD